MKQYGFCALLLAVLLTGCGSEPEPCQPGAAVSGMEADTRFSEAQDGFAAGLLREAQRVNGQENTMVSPYSVTMALAMTANGAAGDTLSETEQLLGGIPVGSLNQYLFEWRKHQPDSKTCKLRTANAVWYRDAADFMVKQDFLQKCALFYQADAFPGAFDDKTVKEVNQWVSKSTDNLIPSIIDRFDPLDRMVLVNAVCFDAKWQKPFEKDDISDDIFTAADGTEQHVPFLSSTEHTYLEADGACGFVKPYDGDCAFVGILPPEGMSVQAYLDSLTREGFEKLLTKSQNAETHVRFPEYSYDTALSLNGILQTLGMNQAFTDAADFSGISDAPLHISNVLHKTHIEVDAKGTKAAASTAVMMQTNGMDAIPQHTVILNRPFVYVILDTQNDLPLFLGTVHSIT